MRLSTSVLKKGKMPQFDTWMPADFTPESPLEERELLMYAEGVTEPRTWIAPEERGELDHLHDSQFESDLNLQQREIINVLVEKKKGSTTSPVFKSSEIPVFPFELPEIELIQEKTPEEEPQPSSDPEIETIRVEEIIEEANQQAEQIIGEAKQQANDILAQARIQAQAEAERIVGQAKSEAETILQQAEQSKNAITQEAERKGLEAAREEASHFLQTAQSIIAGLEKAHDLILERSEEEVIQLVKTIVQNLFANGTALPENVLREAFQQAVEEAKSLGNLRIRANPEDIAVLGEIWLSEQRQLRNIAIEWIPSEDILRGGCVIEGEFGSLDARVNARLERILNKIEEVQQLPADAWQEDQEEEFSLPTDLSSGAVESESEAESEETLSFDEMGEDVGSNAEEISSMEASSEASSNEMVDDLPLNLSF